MKKTFTIQQICVCAVMIALHIVLELLAIRIGNDYKITFAGLPFVVIAVFYGPLAGFATGLVGTFLSQLLTFGITVTTPLWILPGAVHGLTMGLLHLAFKRKMQLKPIGICIFISGFITTLFNLAATYFDSRIFHYYWDGYLLSLIPIRLLNWGITSVIYCAVIMLILKAVGKIYPGLIRWPATQKDK